MNLEYKTKYLKYKKKYLKLKEIIGGSAYATDDGPTLPRRYVPPALRNQRVNTRATTFAAATAPGANADLIKTKGDLIFRLLKQNIKESDKIIIIDFENIKRKIAPLDNSGEQVLINDYRKKLRKLTWKFNYKNIVSERQHILAWLYIIKFYANHPDSEKNFDKIIIICKESTWQEWFDYAFTQFPGKEEELKSKFLIVNVKIKHKMPALNRAPLLEKAHRGIDDFFMFIIKLYLQSYNINNIKILTYDLSCNVDFNNFKQLLFDSKLSTDADLKTTIIISHKKLGFKAWDAYKKTKTNTDPLVQIIETAYTDTNKSLLYDIQALENIDILQCGDEILETQKQYFENYKNSKVPDIENFHYDRVVSTIEDLTTEGYLEQEKLEDYKQKIIKPASEIKREQYVVHNLDNYDTEKVRTRKKLVLSARTKPVSDIGKIPSESERANVTITKPPEELRTLANVEAAQSPPRLKKSSSERPTSSEVREVWEIKKTSTEETSTEETSKETELTPEEKKKKRKKKKREKQKQKLRQKKAAAAAAAKRLEENQ